MPGYGQQDSKEGFRYSKQGKVREKKIVVFDEGLRADSFRDILGDCDGHVLRSLPLINAALVLVDEDECEKVRSLVSSRSGVIRIDDDIELRCTSPVIAQNRASDFEIPWNLFKTQAYECKESGRGVSIAVIDTGVDNKHPAIRSKIVGVYAATEYKNNPYDENGHGTHVAGTIVSDRLTNGVCGIAQNARIYSYKALDETGSGRLSDLIEGLEWCIDNKIRLANLSLSARKENQSFREAIHKARAAGLIMVCASGNYGPGEDTITYPAKYAETIAVAACDESGRIATFSGRGNFVDITAPGVNIKSSWPDAKYKIMSGTSMASPHVTGIIAMMLEIDPTLTSSDIKSILQSTAMRIQGYPFEAQGYGIVNAKKATNRARLRQDFSKEYASN